MKFTYLIDGIRWPRLLKRAVMHTREESNFRKARELGSLGTQPILLRVEVAYPSGEHSSTRRYW